MGWIRNFCLDPDPELGKFRAGSGINHSGSTTLVDGLQFFDSHQLKNREVIGGKRDLHGKSVASPLSHRNTVCPHKGIFMRHLVFFSYSELLQTKPRAWLYYKQKKIR